MNLVEIIIECYIDSVNCTHCVFKDNALRNLEKMNFYQKYTAFCSIPQTSDKITTLDKDWTTHVTLTIDHKYNS